MLGLDAGATWVRQASPADVPQLARVHVASWTAAYAGIIHPHNLAPTTVTRSQGRFQGFFLAGGQTASVALHVLGQGERVLGYVNCGRVDSGSADARGEIFELYLDPQAQGRGFGGMLFSAGMWALAERELQPMIVWALTANLRARHFYLKMGGRELARGWAQVGDQRLAKVAYLWEDYLPWPTHLCPLG